MKTIVSGKHLDLVVAEPQEWENIGERILPANKGSRFHIVAKSNYAKKALEENPEHWAGDLYVGQGLSLVNVKKGVWVRAYRFATDATQSGVEDVFDTLETEALFRFRLQRLHPV